MRRILIFMSLVLLGLILIGSFLIYYYKQDKTFTFRNCFAPITLVSTEQTPKIGLFKKHINGIQEIDGKIIENYRKFLGSDKTDNELFENINEYLIKSTKKSKSGFPLGPNEYDVCISNFDDACTLPLLTERLGTRPMIPADMLPIGASIELDGVVKKFHEGYSESGSMAFGGKIHSTVVWLDFSYARFFAKDNPNTLRHIGIIDETSKITSSPNAWLCHGKSR